jgi:hypothetical protein
LEGKAAYGVRFSGQMCHTPKMVILIFKYEM